MKFQLFLLLVILTLSTSTLRKHKRRRMKSKRSHKSSHKHSHKHSHKQNPRIRNINTQNAVTSHVAGDTHVTHTFPNGGQVIEGPMNRWQPIGQSAFSPTTISPSRQQNQFTYHANVAPLVKQARQERVVQRNTPRVVTQQDKYDQIIDRIIAAN